MMLEFIKMHGLGNDFIIFNGIDKKLPNFAELAKKLCDRHFGVGADGIMIVEKSQIADIKMQIYNSDGSEAKMCGNGLRCFSRYVFEHNIVDKEEFTVETLGGIMKPRIILEGNKVESIKINLGKPKLSTKWVPVKTDKDKFINESIEVEGTEYKLSTIIMGCVHTVIFIDDIKDIDARMIGPLIENHPILKEKTNVNFCQLIDNENIKVITWEIGAGPTLACGTGAASVGVIASLLYDMNNKINMHLLGGIAEIEIIDEDVYLTGPAKVICKGYYNWE